MKDIFEEFMLTIIVVLFSALIFGYVGYKSGVESGKEIIYKLAIADGVGEYYIVEKETGNTEFRWITK